MDEKIIAALLATERRRYTDLSEVMELTGELSDAVRRQDQVSVHLFLSMRQEPINRLREDLVLQRKRCASLPDGAGEALWQVLTGAASAGSDQLAELERAAGQNRGLLERIRRADRQISEKLCGKKSFYHP